MCHRPSLSLESVGIFHRKYTIPAEHFVSEPRREEAANCGVIQVSSSIVDTLASLIEFQMRANTLCFPRFTCCERSYVPEIGEQ